MRISIAIITTLFLASTSFANQKLIELYKTEVPFTFGLLMDMNLKIFSMQHSHPYCKTNLYIGRSGNVQLHLNYFRKGLPSKKKDAESLIEDMSMKIKVEAEDMVKNMWGLYPHELPQEAFADGRELITSIVFLDNKQIGFSENDMFYWRAKGRDNRVIKNKW